MYLLKSGGLPFVEVSKNENLQQLDFKIEIIESHNQEGKNMKNINKEGKKKAFHGFSTVKLERSEQ